MAQAIPSAGGAHEGGELPHGIGARPRTVSAEEAAQVREAGARTKKIRRVAAVASFNAWTAAVAATIALASGFWSLPALVLGVGLAAGAFFEFKGRRMVLGLESRGAKVLAMNQAVIAGSVVVYCAWSMISSMHESSALSELNSPEIDQAVREQLGQSAQSLVSVVTVGVYGVVIVLTGIIQGLTALYYLSRVKMIAEHRARTPAWILDVQRGLDA